MGGFVRGVLVAAALLAAMAAEAAAQDRGLTLKIKASAAADAPVAGEVRLYKSSHALVIGIDAYTGGWPRLSNAVKDAELVAAALTRRGFAVTLKRDLGSADLKRSFEEFFAIRGEDPDARLFVWFAGHGHTEHGEGYIVPADAPRPEAGGRFRLSALSLRRFGDLVRLARSKHAMTVFDACFAGTVFTTQRALPPAAVTRATTLPVRQFVASGDAGQTVSDDGTFRKLFLRALAGEERADANGDGYLTGTELGLWLTDRLTNLTNARQTPRYGKLRDEDWDRGDFVFALAAPPPPRTSIPAAPTPPTGMPADIVFWQSIQSSANPALFEEFLKQFPSSPFADLARLKVKELKGAEVAVVVPPKASIEVDELDGAFVAIRSANIRSEPSAKSEWVGRVAADDRVNVTGKVKERDWYRVEHQGKTGFVFAPLLTALTPLSPTPGMEPLPTTARRAIFLDAASGRVLFEKAADETFEPGSIAQLMTLYLLFERLHDGKLSLEETFPVSETAWRKGGAKSGGSTMFLKPGSWVGVEDLLRGIVISSGADASIVVAETLLGSEAAFVREMENRAKSLGLSKSRFKNASGWPAPGQEMSARDAARLARRLFRDFPQYYHYFSEKAFTYNGIRQANRNPLLYKDLGADGLKTGHVASAGYGLVASVVRGGVRGILVISGLSGAKERAREAERLITLGLERLAEQASRVKELQKQKTAALVPPKAPAPGDIKIDILKFDSDGNAVMSGRAPPGAVLVVKAGDQVIGEVTADPRGEWVFIPDKPLSTAAPNIIVVPKNKGGKLAAARLPPRRPPAGRLPQGRAAARVPPPFSRARPGSPPVPVRPAIGVFPERNKPGDVFKDCADCPEMVVIPAGSFRMGDLQGGGYKAEKPVHDVRIGYAFAVGKYEVTQGEWRVMMGNDPSYFKGERNPVENVSWNDTKEYVRKLSARTGKEYRLLSEAEWEYMARAGSSTKYPWGNDISSSQARYGRQIGHGTVSVGSYAPNAFGVYDTVGNVWEWVEDCWHDSYSGAPTDGGAWMSGGECGRRVLRGGSWYYRPRYVRAALRFMIVTVSSGDSLGFRVARTLSR